MVRRNFFSCTFCPAHRAVCYRALKRSETAAANPRPSRASALDNRCSRHSEGLTSINVHQTAKHQTPVCTTLVGSQCSHFFFFFSNIPGKAQPAFHRD
eukprot:3233326-Amphidinium_carterae.1